MMLKCGSLKVKKKLNRLFQFQQQVDFQVSKDPTPSGVVRQSVLDIITFICKFLLSWQAVFRITDNALNILFKFFGLLLFKLKAITGHRDVEALYQHFPTSLFLARKKQLENCNFLSQVSFHV